MVTHGIIGMTYLGDDGWACLQSLEVTLQGAGLHCVILMRLPRAVCYVLG